MRAIVLKFLILLTGIVFIDYIAFVAIGCTANAFGCGESFFCGVFCTGMKSILGLSLIVPLVVMIKDIRLKTFAH
jgi:hypothetical protein